MIKIAISGKAKSGKNTCSDIIEKSLAKFDDMYKEKFVTAFANPIKEIILDKYPEACRQHIYGSSEFRSYQIPNVFKDGKPYTYRDALIEYGTKGRAFDSELWINHLFNNIGTRKIVSDVKLVIVTDLRFKNEMEALKKENFFLIRVKRDDALITKINHESETSLDEIPDSAFDFIINNVGTIDDLTHSVNNVLQYIVSVSKIANYKRK